MRRVLLAAGIALLVVLPGAVPPVESETCSHGCSTLGVSFLDYVVITQPVEGPCDESCGDDGVQYKIQKTSGCGGTLIMGAGTFCTDENIPLGTYQVNAIGSGCSGTPQGCVRLCACP